MVESADRVLRVLEAFEPSEGDVTLGALAERLGLPKSSVHRVLATLVRRGFVERDASTRRYRLGIRLFELGSAAIRERGLHRAVHPALEELSSSTGETCHLAVLSGREAVYVYKLDGPSSIIMSSRVGARAPLHATSIGKVLAAWAGEEFLGELARQALPAFTPRTITTSKELMAELDAVRRRGYALDLEEFEEGLRCIAAPVRDMTGRVVAAIGISGPRWRFEDGQITGRAEVVMATARTLSRELGHIEAPAALPVAAHA